MLLQKWSPFSSFDPFDNLMDIQREVNRLFDDRTKPAKRDEFRNVAWSPVVDVHEDKDAYYVTAELPGLKQKDIDIKVEDDTLTIKGERKFEDEQKKDNYHRIERFYGSFQRSFTLPRGIDAGKIKASYKDGVLKLDIPKKEESKPKQISVSINDK